MKQSYLDNLKDTMVSVNKKSFDYGDYKAWDNKKAKTLRKHYPRGPAIRRIEGLKIRAFLTELFAVVDEFKEANK